jgi:sugar/nucleoside kinase (ribokinase family)
MLDLIVIGDSTIDIYVQIHEAQIKCSVDKQTCQLCVQYGDKIPVDKLRHTVAGNAANSAVGSARLGLKAGIYTNIGSDSSGLEIIKTLKKEGVDIKNLIKNEGMESNLSVVLNFKGERTIFVYHQDWQYKLPDIGSSSWIYFTSVSKSVEDSLLYDEIAKYIELTNAKLLYNPGTNQLRMDIKKQSKILILSELFIVNKQEAEQILGLGVNRKSGRELLKALSELGPKMVVITDGENGSYGYDGDKYYKLQAFPAKLVEMTGAGDGYATGVLSGLFHGKSLMEAMRWGAANGASVVEQIGPQAGLLTYSQMHEKLSENSKIVAKEV